MGDIFIFSYLDRDLNGIFRDISTKNNEFEFVLSHKEAKTKIGKKLKSFFLRYTYVNNIKIPFYNYWFNLDNYHYLKGNNYYVVLPSSSIGKMTSRYLKRFRQKHNNVKLIALLTDSMHAESPHMDYVRGKLISDIFDLILTYDRYDAEEYGFEWFGYTYYSSYDFVESSDNKSDIYYIGFNKGNREKLIEDIYQKMINEDVKSNFYVIDNNEKHTGILHYENKKRTYPEVVSEVKSTNCILEVLQEKQQTQSLRYFEAIEYNKKLLTNNQNLKDLPYYNEKWMKVFRDISDIDCNWIKEKTDIDYGYKGEYSPINLLGFLKNYYKL